MPSVADRTRSGWRRFAAIDVNVSNTGCFTVGDAISSLPLPPFPPSRAQVQYHVGMGPDPAGLVTYCNKTGIVLEAYSPLAGGRLLKTNASFPHGAELAAKYHWASAAQVGLAYIAQRGLPVVTKSSDPRYLAEDLDLFGPSHAIDQADREQIDALTQPNCEMEAPGGCCHAA